MGIDIKEWSICRWIGMTRVEMRKRVVVSEYSKSMRLEWASSDLWRQDWRDWSACSSTVDEDSLGPVVPWLFTWWPNITGLCTKASSFWIVAGLIWRSPPAFSNYCRTLKYPDRRIKRIWWVHYGSALLLHTHTKSR